MDTRFKKGHLPWNTGKRGVQVAWNKGKKTGKPSWNSGKKGLQVAWNKGTNMSEEAKRKMSETKRRLFSEGKLILSRLGKHLTEEQRRRLSEAHKGIIAGMSGKRHSEEAKRKMSETHKRILSNPKLRELISEATRKAMLNPEVIRRLSESHKGKPTWNKGLIGYMAGEKSPFWKGGISFEPYSTDWTRALKEMIRKRDRYTCQICGKIQGAEKLNVHHIDYNKKNCNPENLITLCRTCHTKTSHHRKEWSKLLKHK